MMLTLLTCDDAPAAGAVVAAAPLAAPWPAEVWPPAGGAAGVHAASNGTPPTTVTAPIMCFRKSRLECGPMSQAIVGGCPRPGQKHPVGRGQLGSARTTNRKIRRASV